MIGSLAFTLAIDPLPQGGFLLKFILSNLSLEL